MSLLEEDVFQPPRLEKKKKTKLTLNKSAWNSFPPFKRAGKDDVEGTSSKRVKSTAVVRKKRIEKGVVPKRIKMKLVVSQQKKEKQDNIEDKAKSRRGLRPSSRMGGRSPSDSPVDSTPTPTASNREIPLLSVEVNRVARYMDEHLAKSTLSQNLVREIHEHTHENKEFLAHQWMQLAVEYEVRKITTNVAFAENVSRNPVISAYSAFESLFGVADKLEKLGIPSELPEKLNETFESHLLDWKDADKKGRAAAAKKVQKDIALLINMLQKTILHGYKEPIRTREPITPKKRKKKMNPPARVRPIHQPAVPRRWRDISHGVESVPIPTVNDQDMECMPHFDYVVDRGSMQHFDAQFLVGCKCAGRCDEMECSCVIDKEEDAEEAVGHQRQFVYDSQGRVDVRDLLFTRQPIYECNARCSCGPHCQNRVVQNGLHTRLKVFRTKDGLRGWGVRTLQKLYEGEFLFVYAGELIDRDELELREEKYPEGTSYLFELQPPDVGEGDERYMIDATYKGNVSRFVNHCCDPNLLALHVYINDMSVSKPEIAFFALRDIKVGEELTFDYKMVNLVNGNQPACLCGAKNCKGMMDGGDMFERFLQVEE